MSFLKKICEVAISGDFGKLSTAEMLIMRAFAENHGDSIPLFAGQQSLTSDVAKEVVNTLHAYNIHYLRMGNIGADFPKILKAMKSSRCDVQIEIESEFQNEILITLSQKQSW